MEVFSFFVHYIFFFYGQIPENHSWVNDTNLIHIEVIHIGRGRLVKKKKKKEHLVLQPDRPTVKFYFWHLSILPEVS